MSLTKFIAGRSDDVQAKRERRKEARPGELLDAALDLFVERGYADYARAKFANAQARLDAATGRGEAGAQHAEGLGALVHLLDEELGVS